MKLKKVSKIMSSEQDKTVDWCVKWSEYMNI